MTGSSSSIYNKYCYIAVATALYTVLVNSSHRVETANDLLIDILRNNINKDSMHDITVASNHSLFLSLSPLSFPPLTYGYIRNQLRFNCSSYIVTVIQCSLQV